MDSWNPWKVTAISMFVVLAVALVTGVVVASFTGPMQADRSEAPRASSGPTPIAPAQSVVPTQAAVNACNRYAAESAPQEKTKEIGATSGVLYGLNENRKNDERYRAAYGSCMRGKGYAG